MGQSSTREGELLLNGIGLVLAGGGGKGAYQIGVWKYLHEVGLDRNVCAVSGTSVGALNAALFAAGDYTRAEAIWMNIRPELILSPPKYSVEDVKRWLEESGIPSTAQNRSGGRSAPPVSTLAGAMSRAIGQSLPFSREGLWHLMGEGVDFNAIRNAPFPCYATCLTAQGLEIRRFDLRRYAPEDAQTILLASSAIPLVFENVTFEGEAYCDGGVPFVGDNVPIAPVARMDVRYIIVVHLTQDVLINHDLYPGAKLIEITPQTDLGDLVTGTLDFTAEGAARRMEQGYQDTKRALGGFVEASLIHRQNELIFQAFEASEQRYRDRITMMKAQQTEFPPQWDRESYFEMWDDFSAASSENTASDPQDLEPEEELLFPEDVSPEELPEAADV